MRSGGELNTTCISRRAFLVRSGVVSCGFAFGVVTPGATAGNAAPAPGTGAVAPNAWVTLHSDGTIRIVAPGIELGQGTLSTLPRYVAEELDADWSHVRVVPAPADEATYGNPLFWGVQITAGSRTCQGYFDAMRTAGAQARYILLTTAAGRLQVSVDSLSTSNSFVIHEPSGRRVSYGDLVADATVPGEFPTFIGPDDKPQEPDDFFGDGRAGPPPESHSQLPPVKLKSRDQFKYLGVDAPRIDLPPKVDGKARFGIDIQLPGMLYAMVEVSPVQGNSPTAVEDADARAVPNIIDIFPLPYGVAVVGNDINAVRKAREMLKVTWAGGGPARNYSSTAVLEDFARIAGDPASHPGVRVYELGHAAAIDVAFAKHKTLVFESKSEFIYHAPIEPVNATARVAADGRSAEGWLSTQWPTMEKNTAATTLGIKPRHVRIEPMLVGGSFGRKQDPGALEDAIRIAKKIGKPVKVIWTREDDLRRNPHRQALLTRSEAAVDENGHLLAMRHRVVGDSWFARQFPDWFKQYQESDPGNWIGCRHLYGVPLQRIDCVTERRGINVCYLRGIGATQNKFALECLIDQVAALNHRDPIEYRLQLLKDVPRSRQVLQEVSRMADWHRRRPGRALGVAYTAYSNSHTAMITEVSVDRKDGTIRVHHVWCAIDAGFAVQPAIIVSQIEGGILQGISMGLYEQVTVVDGVMQQSNFHDYPIMRMSQAPEVSVKVLSTDNAVTGVAEIGVIPVAAAVNNAVAQLIGVHLKNMPMLPATVLAALATTP
jgi:isoquinoline 1-oxidoreductase beta subunit